MHLPQFDSSFRCLFGVSVRGSVGGRSGVIRSHSEVMALLLAMHLPQFDSSFGRPFGAIRLSFGVSVRGSFGGHSIAIRGSFGGNGASACDASSPIRHSCVRSGCPFGGQSGVVRVSFGVIRRSWRFCLRCIFPNSIRHSGVRSGPFLSRQVSGSSYRDTEDCSDQTI